MTKALCAAGRLRSLPAHPSHQSIWISDALLAESLRRFAHRSRRHGSHVPGPLEARRRASRRKNTGLAFVGAAAGGGPPLDPSLVWGVGQQNGWWKGASGQVESETWRISALQQHPPTAPPLFPPPWFMPSTPVEVGHRSSVREQVNEELDTLLQGPRSYEKDAARLKQHLVEMQEETRNANGLRQVMEALGFNIAQSPRYSNVVFEHMLNAGWGHEHIGAFLLDTKLNPPAASNYTLLRRHLETHAWDLSALKNIFDSTSQAVYLGLVSYDEIRQLLMRLPMILVSVAGTPVVTTLRESSALGVFYRSIFRALEDSSVVAISDLGKNCLHGVIAQLSQTKFDRVKAQLWWSLRRYLGDGELEVATTIFSTWLKDALAREMPHTVTSISSFLQKLPTSLLAETLCAVTWNLAAQTSRGSAELITWHTVLGSLSRANPRNLFNHLCGKTDTIFEKCSVLDERQKLLAFSWMLISLCHSKGKSPELLEMINLEPSFKKAFASTADGVQRDVLAEVLMALQDLSLPHASMLLKHLGDLTHGHVKVISVSDTLQTHHSKLVQHQISVLLDDSTYWHATHNFTDSLSQMAKSINKDLDAFQEVLSVLVATDKQTLRLALRVLKHNGPFKFALSQTFVQRRAALGELRNRRPPENDETGIPSDHVDPLQALFFMNRLAVNLATTPVISAGLAYHKVHWCYLFLHRYGAPITPGVTRALWHAGVTRFLDRGQTPARFKWILSKVEEVEGPAVARQLLWNSGFRDKRAAEMEGVSRLLVRETMGSES